MKKLRQGDLFRAMSDIDAAYIDEAARPVSPKRIHPVRWAVLAACLSLAVGASVLLPLLMQEQPAISASDPGSSPAGGEPVAPPLSGEIPSWYLPGDLSARTLTYAADQIRLPSSQNQPSPSPLPQPSGFHPAASLRKQADNKEVALPSDARVIDCYNASLLQLDPQTVAGHEDCSGLFFDTEAGKLVCLSETLRKKLPNLLTEDASLFVTAYSGETNRCLFSLQSDGGRSRGDYIYDFASDMLIELPAIVGETDTVAALIPLYTPDLRFVAAVDATDDNAPVSLHLVRVEENAARTEHIADYADEYVEPYKRLLFSPDSRYMAYAVPTKDTYSLVGTVAGSWTMRDLSSGAEWQGTGKILRFTADGGAVIVRTESAVQVLNLSNGEDITDSAALQEWEKLEVTAVDLGNRFTGSRYRITVAPLFGGEGRIVAEDVGAYYQSGDYLYTYSHGDAAARCLSLTSGEAFQVPVDAAYLEQTTNLPETLLVHHQLYLSKDGTRLLLRYSTSVKSPDAELAWYAETYNLPNLGRLFDTYGSLAEMESYFRQGMNPPEFDGSFAGSVYVSIPTYYYYQGDGYAFVVHHTENPKETLLFVDDYRDNTFTIYTSYAYPSSYWPIPAEQNPSKYLRKPLPADVQRADSVALYASLPTYGDPVDLADYYTNGVFDSAKMKMRELDFDRIRLLASSWDIVDYTQVREDGSVWGYTLPDISPVEELLQIAQSKPTIGWVTLQAERESKGATRQYQIILGDALNFSVSRLADGRGMVLFNDCYRALDDDEYQRMQEICRALYDDAVSKDGMEG